MSYMQIFNVVTWTAYDITNFSFYIKLKDDCSTRQNNGVIVKVESMYFSSSKDKNPILESITYFGVIKETWEIDYVLFNVSLFKCKWIGDNIDVQTDELGFT
ncbi:hypothetical protein KIW84_030730 [Lathyrus oleraceus]|uniref:Uncharacterized protein n=1 Tax=Pisum sativum TaxID=3888 RepID=A0A9D4XP90_PEA|nr:hypothetical protein KIW84_030730 [Pisum sativum]